MANLIAEIATEDARKYWPQVLCNMPGLTFEPVAWFRVGEGGWHDPGTGPIPRVPSASLRYAGGPPINVQDLDIRVNSALYPPLRQGWFEKALLPTDFTFLAPSAVKVSCLLDFADFNDNGNGFSPEIWELGLFSLHPDQVNYPGVKTMLAYCTFPKEIKNVTKQILNVVRLVF